MLRTVLLWVARPVLALLAYLAGVVIGRPMSGRWLAHYFLSTGKPMRLNPRMEQELLWFFHHGGSDPLLTSAMPAEWDHVPVAKRGGVEELHTSSPLAVNDPDIPSVAMKSSDLFTTVGSVLVWQEGHLLHYIDVYNWQDGLTWTFACKLGPLPFSIQITGEDTLWSDLGRPFVTSGVLDLDEWGQAPKDTIKDTKRVLLVDRVREWLYNYRHRNVDDLGLPF